MHIAVDALLLKNQNTGTGFYTHHLLEAIAALGTPHRFTVFVDAAYTHTAPFETPSMEVVRVPFSSTLHRIYWEQAVLPRRLRDCGAEVVFYPFFVKALGSNLPSVITIHDMFHLTVPDTLSRLRRLYFSWATERSAHQATHIITVSQHAKADIERLYGIDPERIRVVDEAAGKEFQTRLSPEHVDETLTRYRVPFQKFLLTVGTLEKRKNFGEVFHALHRLKAQGSILNLVLVGGKSNDAEALHTLRTQLGLESQIFFAGYVRSEHLPAFYAAATAMVMPSLYEGFGLPLVEAMSSGTPAIAANRTALPEVIGDAGLLYNTPDELVLHLACIWTDEAFRQNLIAKGDDRAKHFTWQRAAEETVATIERAARLPKLTS